MHPPSTKLLRPLPLCRRRLFVERRITTTEAAVGQSDVHRQSESEDRFRHDISRFFISTCIIYLGCFSIYVEQSVRGAMFGLQYMIFGVLLLYWAPVLLRVLL